MLSRVLKVGRYGKTLRLVPSMRFQSTLPPPFLNSDQKNALKLKQLYDKKARFKRLRHGAGQVALGVLTFAMIMVIWQPWNPFSKQVSFNLRKALWAESDKEDFNYLKALDYYQRALDKCGEEGMDQLDPRYSGIVLKIAEMYEKLGKTDLQREVYEKLSDFLEGKLVGDQVKEEWKDLLLDRDLVISTRLLTLADKPRVQAATERLLDKMMLCEDRIEEKWPFLAQIGADGALDVLEVIDLDSTGFWVNGGKQRKQFIAKHCSKPAQDFLNGWYPDWPYFTENLIRARDLYAMTKISGPMNDFAVELLESNLAWMELSGNYPVFIGTAISNVASAYYMKSERHEVNVRTLQKLVEEDDEDKKEVEKVLASEQKKQIQALDKSEKIYNKLIEKMGGEESVRAETDNTRLQACLSMTFYSLGVIQLHRGDYEGSEKLFSKAKEVALDNGLTQIVERVDSESEVKDKERDILEIQQRIPSENRIV